MTWCRVLGLLSGTSMDGVDVAAAELRLDGDTVELRPLGASVLRYPGVLHEKLLAVLPSARNGAAEQCGAEDLCQLDTYVGQQFAAAARLGVELAGGRADLVASLGQTLYHWVQGSGRVRGTLQIGQPAWIAEATGLPVVSDLRARDVASGGQGAPLAGVFDALWLADEPGTTVALNIGGIANITVVGGRCPLAYDTGPGNALIDLAARRVTGVPQDTDGRIAATGTVHPQLLEELRADAYYRRPAPKSTGKEYFNADYLTRALDKLHDEVSAGDLLATLTELTARTIADACRTEQAAKVVASGGGVRNPVLLAALRRRLDVPLVVSDELGMPADSKEAFLTALLGFLTWHGITGNTPGTTGATVPRVLGSITPGSGALRLPEPATEQPKRLRLQLA
ncbi:anhydro-N-acetylmuramic acid kinase [Saccharopolyspora phatthalungensis]|uniref:Anhydro-N-acetylmuramic acid kinase n=1 Tax=Saccharopolyspora phatthalungensis TaxID=664693 RepID=A0A840Q4V0_9PSEU|nr:anhydro-N-acetylmuramic acid kinase [Saccharopolyspora phatthalungensis]MBB5155506.1 anhydro-N-acetylmuramic acid kinase [Saccharopolyspora phatthalungensis]